jgi:hypothetical protein
MGSRRDRRADGAGGAAVSGHTPGPWNVMPSQRGSLLHVETDMSAPAAGVPICSVSTGMPNALLIAAAPQLLDLLQREPAEGHTKRWQDERRAAIAAATVGS